MVLMEPNRSLALVVWACVLFSCGHALAGQDMVAKKRLITETLEKVRTGATPSIRDKAAEHLAELTRGIAPQEIDDKTVADMVSLLDLQGARYWVAVSLGNLGPRAKIAVPKLREVLAEEDCLRVDKSAAGGIRFALTRMGSTPPPPPNCEKRETPK